MCYTKSVIRRELRASRSVIPRRLGVYPFTFDSRGWASESIETRFHIQEGANARTPHGVPAEQSMGRKGHHSAAKRDRDRAKQEKQAKKRARKAMRGSDDGLSTDELAAPPKKGGTEAEVQAAIERAMNPGKHRARMTRDNGPSEVRLFVGNLDFAASEQDLRELFGGAGYDVVDVRIVTDRQTGDSRGFAFVSLAADGDAGKAISDLDGASLNGRALRINPADQKRR